MRAALVGAGLLVLALVGGLLVWLSSGHTPHRFTVAPEAGSERPKPQGGVCRSPIPAPTSLNPFTTTDPVAVRYVLRYTHDTLFDRDPVDGELRPAAAVEMEDDGLITRFRLRDDLRFPDGAPVTLEDLRFTLAVATHPLLRDGSDMSYVLGQLARAEALDARTLEFERADATGPAANVLAQNTWIVRRAWFVGRVEEVRGRGTAQAPDEDANVPLSDEFVRTLAGLKDCGPGTGAYRVAPEPLTEAVQRGQLDLLRNESSWRRVAQPDSWNLAGLRIRFLREEATRFAALRQGEVDWYNPSGGASAEDVLSRHPALREVYRVHSYEPSHIHSYQVVWNHDREHLGDRRVRRALTMLFDRDSILREVFAGVGRVARGFYKPEEPGGAATLEELPFDPVAAGALLREAGVPVDTRIEVLFPPVATMRRILEFAQPAFTAAGLELVPLPLDPQSILARRDADDFDAYLQIANNAPRRNPGREFGSETNDFGYVSAELDELARRIYAAEGDEALRASLECEAQSLIHADQPVTLLIHPKVELLIHRRFRDAQPGPLGLHFERFWVPASERVFRTDD